jgi:hypothetical protein
MLLSSCFDLLFMIYNTTQREPLETVTVMPELTVIGPVDIAFLSDGIV